jgi:nucleotide-binding universal stress UspA family protein
LRSNDAFVKVLVALDDSARAPHVLETGLQTAERLGGVVVPFRAVQVPPEFPPAAATHHSDDLPRFLVAEATRELERLTAGAPPSLLAPPVVRIGEPWRAVVDASDTEGASLVVVGSHGYHGLDRLLGTTSRHVAEEAHQEVLVVHDRAPSAVRSALIALSGSPRDAAIFAKGLEFAHRWRATVHLLRVAQIANPWPPPRRLIVNYLDVKAAPAPEATLRLAPDDPSIASRRIAVAVARPWRAIVEAARENAVDLVVVGSHGHRARDALARTTTAHIADQATENVLVVHGGPVPT